MLQGITATTLLLLVTTLSLQAQPDCRNNNSNFARTQFDSTLGQHIPEYWEYAVGRFEGGGLRGTINTTISVGEKTGLTLTNVNATNRFLQVHQFFEVDQIGLYSIRTTGLSAQTNGRPFRNGYISLALVDPNKQSPEFNHLGDWDVQPFPVDVSMDDNISFLNMTQSGMGRVALFSDAIGSLKVKSICVAHEPNELSFLIDFISRHYSYFGIRGPSLSDFRGSVQEIPSQVESGVLDKERAVLNILRRLTTTDPHVYVRLTNGTVIAPIESLPSSDLVEPTFAYAWTRLDNVEFGPNDAFLTGTIKDSNIFYVLLPILHYNDTDTIIRNRLNARPDTTGIIVDLRSNSGGNEALGQLLVEAVQGGNIGNDPKVVYARHEFRSSSVEENLFYEGTPRTVHKKRQGTVPKMAVLISKQCVSSCEGTALAFRSVGATLFGEGTAGASGNPIAVPVSNVGRVYLSRWRSLDATGTLLETVGVAPDVAISEATVTVTSDAVLEKAVEFLHNDPLTTSGAAPRTPLLTGISQALACIVGSCMSWTMMAQYLNENSNSW